MNIRSVEGWYVIFQTLSVIFVMLTVGTGAGTIITGYIASKRQEAKLANVVHGNLTLEGEVNTEKGKVASLQKAASDALAEQQRVQTKLGEQEQKNIQLRTDLETATAESRVKQAELTNEQAKLATEQRKTAEAQREAAIAQRALAEKTEEIKKRTEPRHLTDPQRARLVELFRANEKGEISITCLNGDFDSCDFAKQIADVLSAGGWKVDGPHDMIGFGPNPQPPRGLFILLHGRETVPVRAVILQKAFEAIGLTAPAEIKADLAPETVSLLVGIKP